MKFVTNGLIIKQQNIGEQDKLVTVLTKSHGVIRAFARRAKNIKSSKCAATSLLCYSRLTISTRRDTYSIEEASVDEMFIKLRSNVENMSLAQYFCELSLHLCPKESEAEIFLRLILNALSLLSNQKKDPLLIKACVEMRLMSLCGYMPDLVMCSDCGEYKDGQMVFVPKSGKLFCRKCADKSKVLGIVLPISVVTALRHTVYSDFDKLFSFTLSNESLKLLNTASENYLCYMTERDYATLQFYKTIKE